MSDHGPGVRVPPPGMVGGLVALAWGLGAVWPVTIGPAQPGLGTFVALLGIGFGGWALAGMIRAGTDPRPDRPDRVFLAEGAFRFSRTPIYLGFLLIAAGFALRSGEVWGWLAVAGSFLLLDRLVVAREEAYLAGRFGAAYATYRGRVRRWI